MGKHLANIDAGLAAWIAKQRLFFVASAPLAAEGHINASPKGGEAFRILGPMEVAYQDYTGSGAETVAHLRENGRILIMFCALEGPPKIVRLHGRGTVVIPGHPRFDEFAAHFPANPGTRAIIHVTVQRVSSSCGFSVPFFDYREERSTLDDWAAMQGPEKLSDYRAAKNQKSIDGLPAFDI
ncbi:MAG TPA: pyridoxamine 5'-phosphate oxidase family protein [Verrucomicrobiae bacterium]|nr:pyridoxamine 5'-phosphate oxidase family protein [Verrucomicrobiae bacterium]